VVFTGLFLLRIKPVEGSCEQGNEPSGFTKCLELGDVFVVADCSRSTARSTQDGGVKRHVAFS
jgi:hypothetical protein